MSKKVLKTIVIKEDVSFQTTSEWSENEIDISLDELVKYGNKGLFLRIYASYYGDGACIDDVSIVQKIEESDEEYKERIKQEAITKDKAEKEREKDMLDREKAEYERLKKKYGK